MSASEQASDVAGTYHPPGSARAIPARLSGGGGVIVVTPDTGERRTVSADTVTVSDRIAGVPRRLDFADGAAFVTRDDDGLESVVGEKASRGTASWIARLERPSVKLFVVGTIAVLALVASLRWGVPVAASAMAALTPHSINAEIGASTLSTIDRLIVKPSRLAADRQAEIRADFDRLAAAADLTDRVSLNFRDGGDLGPNAFAMPGGVIVVTDQLVELADDPQEVVGVLGHEIAHAEYRHPEQAIWQAIGFGLALTIMFGDAGTLAEEVAAAGTVLVERAYSREHETAADLRAVELMTASGMDPGHFIVALDRLHDECGFGCRDTTWLSSHPGGQERLTLLCSAVTGNGPAAGVCSDLSDGTKD